MQQLRTTPTPQVFCTLIILSPVSKEYNMEKSRNLCITCQYDGDCPIQPEGIVVAQCHLINPRDEFITSPIEDFSYLFTKKPLKIKP